MLCRDIENAQYLHILSTRTITECNITNRIPLLRIILNLMRHRTPIAPKRCLRCGRAPRWDFYVTNSKRLSSVDTPISVNGVF